MNLLTKTPREHKNRLWRLSTDLCQAHGYHRVGGFDEETDTAWAMWQKGGTMFHVDYKTGARIYEPHFTQVRLFCEGLAAVADITPGGLTYHIRLDGKPAYQARFDSVGDFVNGKAWARLDEEKFYILPNGQRA